MFTLSIVRKNGSGFICNTESVRCITVSEFDDILRSHESNGEFFEYNAKLHFKTSCEVNADLSMYIHIENDCGGWYEHLCAGDFAYVMNEAGHTVAKYGCE